MLDNKVVVVTGGAGLIGRQYVRSIVENKGIAIIAEISEEAGRKYADELTAEFGPDRAIYHYLNINDKNSGLRLIDTIKQKFGKIDALVNNAYPKNKNYGKPFEQVTYEDFAENLSTHVGGYFLMMQLFGQYFTEQGYGNIINMSSIYGVMAPRFELYEGVGFGLPVEYAAIKSGIQGLTRYVANYLKKTGVRVNAISPGGILDNQHPLFLERYNSYCMDKGMLDPQDVAGTLVFLLSDASKHITGQNIVVDDGFSL